MAFSIKMTKRVMVLALLLFLVLPGAWADAGGFYYKDFKVDALVRKNNVWEVTETIKVHFNEPRHGIYRYIPYKFSLLRDMAQKGQPENIQTLTFVSRVDDIEVTDETTDISSENDCKVIRIGDEDKTISGDHTYVVKYTYAYPDDRTTEFDYLYHTILGTDFEESIEHFSFNIKFEKPVGEDSFNSLEMCSGAYGDTTRLVQCELWLEDDGSLSGEAYNVAPKHGITLYMPFNEGYYEGVEVASATMMYVWLGLSLLLFAVIIFCITRLRKPSITKQIEFYPPEDICSAEVGYIIDSTVDTNDLGSLIPWFASKGYVGVKEIEEKKLIGKKSVLELTKKHDLPKSAPEYQRTFMRALFGGKSQVRLDKLEARAETIEKAKTQLEEIFTGPKNLTDWNAGSLFYLLLLLTTTMVFVSSSMQTNAFLDNLFVAGGLWTLPFALGIICKMTTSKKQLLRSRFTNISILVLKALAMLAVLCVDISVYCTPDDFITQEIIIAMTLLCFVAGELVHLFCINTKYRADLMGKLLGFREFIKTADKPRLEMMLADDPDFFYKVLPYALVFDLTEIWADHFKDLEMAQPDWYVGTGVYNASLFASSFSDSITVASHSAMASMCPSSSGSGGSISVGGGGGGGGGGSW